MATPNPNFAQRYCERHRLEPTRFARSVVRRTLHWPARWVAWIWLPADPTAFEPDLELATFCGRQSSSREFEEELKEFRYDRRNRGLWRGRLRQRVSTQRLRRLFYHTMSGA